MNRPVLLRRRIRRDDRGSGAVQLPVMAATYVAFIMLLVFVGRVNSGHSAAETAARSAARTIAISRDPTSAMGTAQDEAAAIANVGSASCRSMDFASSVSDTEVTVTVTCQVDLAEVTLTGIPGRWAATAAASEPIDRWREEAVP